MVSFFVKALLTYVHNIVYLYSELHYYISRREERIMARPTKQRCICSLPRVTGFSPQGCKASGSINLTYDEYEVLRLLDHMQMTQREADADLPPDCDQDLRRSQTEDGRYARGREVSYDRRRRRIRLPGDAAGMCRGRALLP